MYQSLVYELAMFVGLLAALFFGAVLTIIWMAEPWRQSLIRRQHELEKWKKENGYEE